MGLARQIIQKTITAATYTTDISDDQIFANATTAPIAVTLTIFPDGAEHVVAVQKTDASGNAVTVSDGTLSVVLAAQNDAAIFSADASGTYHVFASSIA